MSSKAYADRLARAIESTGLAQAVNTSFGESQIKVLCRVLVGGEDKWIAMVRRFLLATEGEADKAHGWQTHICRVYFLKDTPKGKKLVFGWNISVHSGDMGNSLDFLTRAIRSEQPPEAYRPRPGEVEEIEFTGVEGERLPSPGGKGAWTVGGKNDFRVGRSGSGVTK